MGAPPPLSDLEQALAATWGYSSAFGVAPSLFVSQRWLLSARVFSSQVIAQSYIVWQKRLGILSSQNQNDTVIKQQIHSLHQAIRFLRWIPWVQAVWVTGSLAAGTPRENDDVDFLVLTSEKRLWLTRLLVLAGSAIFRRWRWRLEPTSLRTKQTWCWNIWLEPSAGLHSVKPSVYTARELVQARLVFVRKGVSKTYVLDHALWAQVFSRRGVVWARQRSQTVIAELPAGRHWWSVVFDFLNSWAYQVQHWYMRSHLKGEIVARNEAWFHRGNYALTVQKRYETMRQYWIKRMRTTHTFSWPTDWTPLERERLLKVVRQLRSQQDQGKHLVLATGVFDLFHSEHQNFLTKAAQVGDLLLVGIESDARVRSSKGPNRPRDPQDLRERNVSSFQGVTAAVILPENFSKPEHHRALLDLFLPSILAVSSHSPFQDRKAALMREIGGELKVVHQHNPSVSTSQLLESTMQTEHGIARA